MKYDYIPVTDSAKLSWAQNFEDKLPAHAAALGLTAAEVTAQQDILKAIKKSINDKVAAQAAAKKAKADSDKIVADSIKDIRGTVRGWKENPNYTDAIGADLQIVGTDSSFDPKTFKTILTAIAYPGRVEIGFTKGESEGVNVYTRLKGQATWLKLSFDAHPPYVDNRPLAVANAPEHREYMAIGVLDDAEIGQASDIVEVVFGG